MVPYKGGFRQWQRIDKHHAYTIYALDYVRRVGKRIMLITVSIAISIGRGLGQDIEIRKERS